MQRAAAGLARRCALLLEPDGGVYGAEVFLLVGSGDNGGDALYAGARLAARGARVRALLLARTGCTSPGSPRCAQAGGFTVRDLPDRADLVLDGIVGIGASGGLRPDAAAIVGTLGRAARAPRAASPGGRGGRAQRGGRGHRRRARRRGDRGRDRDVRLPETGARGGCRPRPWPGRSSWSTSGSARPCAAIRRSGCRTPPTSPAGGPGPEPIPTSTPAASSGVATGSARYPGAAVLSVAGALRRPDRHGPVCGQRRRGRGAGPSVRGRRRRASPTPAGCRPGCAVPGSAPTTTPAPSCARCWPPRCRCCWTPTR